MSNQEPSRSLWNAVKNSSDFPLFLQWIKAEQIPQIEQQILALDPLDNDLSKCYISLSGELKAFTGIIVRYETALKENDNA